MTQLWSVASAPSLKMSLIGPSVFQHYSYLKYKLESVSYNVCTIIKILKTKHFRFSKNYFDFEWHFISMTFVLCIMSL